MTPPAMLLYILAGIYALAYVHELAHKLAVILLFDRPARISSAGFGLGTYWNATGVGRAGMIVSIAGPLTSLAVGWAICHYRLIPYWWFLGVFSFFALGVLNLIPIRGMTDGSHVIAFARGRIGQPR